MKKLTIAGRTNWEGGAYIKFKAEEKAMIIIKKIVGELGSDYFIDNHIIPKTFSDYSKWKDQWIPVYNYQDKDLDINIICGDKIIHMLVHKCPSFEALSKLLEKYCEWAKIKYKKGFDLNPNNQES